MTFNEQKSSRYAFALGRIRSAMQSEFYLEALTIEESLITDRRATRERSSASSPASSIARWASGTSASACSS